MITVASLLFAFGVNVWSTALAQPYAPGDAVSIPGVAIAGWGMVERVEARFGKPPSKPDRLPAVLILHGSGGVDGRGAYYAQALQEAGIATLEITMFAPGGRPREGTKATMPFAAAALKWLAAQPAIDASRLGVMGLSWGGVMTVLLSSALVQERLGVEVPKPVAFAAFYPTCAVMARFTKNRDSAFFDAPSRMTATPMLIQVGTKDDYEDDERACDAFVASWPQAARERTTVRYFEGATHGFDIQGRSREFRDEFAHGGRGGMVRMAPSPDDAVAARTAVVEFFAKHLKP